MASRAQTTPATVVEAPPPAARTVPPVASRVDPGVTSRVEPRAASHLEPPVASRVEPREPARVPPAVPRPQTTRPEVGVLDPVLVAALAPHSLAAEQYRALRTRIIQAENGRPIRVVMVTSPGKGDGKSVNAANLALTMAQQFQSRVLLLDADLRHPQAHRLLGVHDGPGLADVLMGGADIDEALVTVPGQSLWLLPAGLPPGHPAELLGSSAMRRVVDTLRTRFDRIIVDTPPVAPLADVRILAPMTDGVVVVVRAGVTPRPAIERALAGFDRSRLLGVVLNAADGDGPDGYGYAHYGDGAVAG
jgi:capsular exopolysaccharide synthesis family protein